MTVTVERSHSFDPPTFPTPTENVNKVSCNVKMTTIHNMLHTCHHVRNVRLRYFIWLVAWSCITITSTSQQSNTTYPLLDSSTPSPNDTIITTTTTTTSSSGKHTRRMRLTNRPFSCAGNYLCWNDEAIGKHVRNSWMSTLLTPQSYSWLYLKLIPLNIICASSLNY